MPKVSERLTHGACPRQSETEDLHRLAPRLDWHLGQMTHVEALLRKGRLILCHRGDCSMNRRCDCLGVICCLCSI